MISFCIAIFALILSIYTKCCEYIANYSHEFNIFTTPLTRKDSVSMIIIIVVSRNNANNDFNSANFIIDSRHTMYA